MSDEGTSVEFDTNTNLVAAKVAIVGGGRGGRGTIHGMSIGGQQLPLDATADAEMISTPEHHGT